MGEMTHIKPGKIAFALCQSTLIQVNLLSYWTCPTRLAPKKSISSNVM